MSVEKVVHYKTSNGYLFDTQVEAEEYESEYQLIGKIVKILYGIDGDFDSCETAVQLLKYFDITPKEE